MSDRRDRLTMEEPDGWPGEVILEGRTILYLPPRNSEEEVNRLGPGDREEREVFHNSAMAASRTRSVVLMAHEFNDGWLGAADKPIQTLDALTATGARSLRWLHELPEEAAARLQLTQVDRDERAIGWAAANLSHNPPKNPNSGVEQLIGDVRQISLGQGWQWVDIDPFGSPVPFLDTVLQSTARRAVIEVTATDTAALTGSSASALRRRYGARARLDSIAHDTGLRILLARIAENAARHDRAIEPLLSIWDGHHLRVSLRVTRSVEEANEVEQSLGWRIADPTAEEVSTPDDEGVPHILVPLAGPVDITDERVSGPLWIGPLGNAETMAAMSEERAVELCAPADVGLTGDSEDRLANRAARRAVGRAVRHIAEEASAIHATNLIVVDDIPSRLDIGSPPSPTKLASMLRREGYSAAVAAYGNPAIRTDAPWSAISAAVLSL
jgi:tRNA (guanine26-N2/guanine27-N2)-dimethyltransferase